MKNVKIYTDAVCKGNPGRGGYGIVIMTKINDKIYKKEFSKGYKLTTNNRMELLAVIEGLKKLKFSCNVNLYSDSSYVVNAINKKWLDNWQKTNWENNTVKNIDLWKQLIPLLKIHNVEFNWVKGHSSNIYNNRCDELAVNARLSNDLLIDEIYEKYIH